MRKSFDLRYRRKAGAKTDSSAKPNRLPYMFEGKACVSSPGKEDHEPRYIHVETAENAAKFWLSPVSLAWAVGYDSREVRQLRELVEGARVSFWRSGVNALAPLARLLSSRSMFGFRVAP